MPRAIRFDRYGNEDVLYVADVPTPEVSDGEVIVRVRSAGVSTGEAKIRSGDMDKISPAHFPEGEGTEFAGVVHAVGSGVEDFAVGDEVIGWAEIRGAQADYVPAPPDNIVKKPAELDWNTAASTPSPGATATSVLAALQPRTGQTLVVAGASGGVGLAVTQLAILKGVTVIATASEFNHDYLRRLGAHPIAYGDGLKERIEHTAPHGVHCYADCHGGGNVDLALSLGVEPERINTIADFPAAGKVGANTAGMYQLDDIKAAVEPFVAKVAAGQVDMPIKAVYPLEQIHDAYRRLTQPGGIGRVVLEISDDTHDA